MKCERTTVDVWEFWTHYGDSWDCECIETSGQSMRENRKAYQQAGVPVRIRKRRVRKDRLANHDPKRP
jgi:hypothetical protein